jgi:carbamoyl-phosphate synthase large subunit
VLIDRFLEDAVEVDVDAIADGERVIVAGVMEHIEEAGVHSGDSACAIPPYSLPGPGGRGDPPGHRYHGPRTGRPRPDERPVRRQAKRRAGPVLYVMEVNPRASRTVPFVSKATGRAAGQGGGQGDGRRLAGRAGHCDREPIPAHVSVKEAVFPFVKFAGVDIVLGPEMKSTGEVMGISERFSIAFAKSQLAAGSMGRCSSSSTLPADGAAGPKRAASGRPPSSTASPV